MSQNEVVRQWRPNDAVLWTDYGDDADDAPGLNTWGHYVTSEHYETRELIVKPADPMDSPEQIEITDKWETGELGRSAEHARVVPGSAPPTDAQGDDDHATRESRLQYLCAAMYQAAGSYDMPVRFLDALSKAGNGGDVSVEEIEALLPCDCPAPPTVPDEVMEAAERMCHSVDPARLMGTGLDGVTLKHDMECSALIRDFLKSLGGAR